LFEKEKKKRLEKPENGGIKAKMKKGGFFMLNCKYIKKSTGYMPIEAAFCNDDKLHVPLGSPSYKNRGFE